MATFEYSAMTASDRLMKGVIEAGSVQEASELLEQMRLKVNSLEKAKSERPKSPIARTEFLLFNQQLASLTQGGNPSGKRTAGIIERRGFEADAKTDRFDCH